MLMPDRLRLLAQGGLTRPRGYGAGPMRWAHNIDGGVAGWDTLTSFGVASNETALVRFGSQSIRLTATVGEDQEEHCYKADLFPVANFSSGKHWFELTVHTQALNALAHKLYLFGNNGVVKYGTINLADGGKIGNGWHTLFGPLALDFAVGGFDLSDTTGVGYEFTKGDVTDFVVLDNLAIYKSTGLPQVCFTVDDGLTHAAKIARMVNGFGWPVHHGIIAGKVGAAGYLTRAQLDEEYLRGNSIGSHTMNHLAAPRNWAAVGVQEALDEAVGAKERLLSWGYERGSDVFVAPFGLGSDADEVTQAKLDAIAPYFRHVVNTNPPLHPAVRGLYQNGGNADFPSPLLPSQRRIISRMLQDNDGTFPFNSTAITRIINATATGVVMLHQLDTGAPYHTTATFASALDALRVATLAGTCAVRSLQEVLDP